MVFADAVIRSDDTEDECKGLFFRGRTSAYVNGDTYGEKVTLRLLKRMSCKGCSKCCHLIDDLNEQIYASTVGTWGGESQLDIEIKDGHIYQLQIIESSIDWESGLCDNWTVGFREVKLEEDNVN